MTDPQKVHPLRRKHRRGKRGKKRDRATAVVPIAPIPVPPSTILSLRKRLSTLANHG